MNKIKSKNMKNVLSLIMITIGALLASFSLETLLIPNTILDGGITGISIILSKITSLPISILIIIINIPFLYIGYKNMGKNFLMKAIYSMLIFSIGLLFFAHIESITNQMLLATVYGGFLLGIGCGLVIRFGGCLDGTESIAIIISKKYPISVGQIILLINLIIYMIAGLIFGIDRALYSLLTYFITFKVIDAVSEGLEQGKAAMIITDQGKEISKEIYKRLGRTTTKIRGEGLISGDKEILYCVMTRIEVPELRRIAEETDESAFITITDISEIIGNHIKSTKKIRKLNKK